MLNDYKPTHDPNIDTFKVQYLLGSSAVLALLFPHDYSLSEVGSCCLPDLGKSWYLTTARFFGRSRFGWSPLPSYPSFLCCSEPEKQTLSRRIICLRWVLIELCTFPTGCIATLRRATFSQSRFWRVSFKRCCTPTFSIFTTRSEFQATQVVSDD